MSDLAAIAAGIGALLAAIAGFVARAYFKGKSDEANKQETDALRDAFRREQAGREAVQRGRASGADPDDRLRDNDSAW